MSGGDFKDFSLSPSRAKMLRRKPRICVGTSVIWGPCCATECKRRALWDRPIDRVVAHIGIQIQIILAPNRIEPRGAAEAAL